MDFVAVESPAAATASATAIIPFCLTRRARSRSRSRAASPGAPIGPNSVRLRTASDAAAATCKATSVPIECATRCAGAPATVLRISPTASTSNSIVILAKGSEDRPAPGRSGRMQRKPPSESSSGWKELELAPSPCRKTIGGPSPSISSWIWPSAAPLTGPPRGIRSRGRRFRKSRCAPRRRMRGTWAA